jgi:glycine/D-amino acid oxidase-like deaminating enzyme
MPDVVVVGGGVIGAACAWELASHGHAVTLLEREELAAGASGRNQGWIVEPDDPANVPLFDPSRFLEAAERSPIPIWVDREPIAHLTVALEGDEAPAPAGASSLSGAELRELEPDISPRAVGGWAADGGRRLDPRALTVGMALLAAEAGARIRHHLPVRALLRRGERVRGVVTDEGTIGSDEVVLAAGPWSGDLLAPLGISLPLTAARGWIVRLAPTRPVVRHLVERAGWRASGWRAGASGPPRADAFAADGVTALGGALLNPHVDGTVLVGSSREPSITPEPAEPRVPRWQVRDAIELVPALADAEVRTAWWGTRPMTPDERPAIGRLGDGLVLATGHGSEGVLMAAGTARLVAALATGLELPFDPAPWDPSRFATG